MNPSYHFISNISQVDFDSKICQSFISLDHIRSFQVLWSTTFVLFISDTQLWFTLLCSILGVATVMVQRGCRCFTWALEDSVAKLPERFSRKAQPMPNPFGDGFYKDSVET